MFDYKVSPQNSVSNSRAVSGYPWIISIELEILILSVQHETSALPTQILFWAEGKQCTVNSELHRKTRLKTLKDTERKEKEKLAVKDWKWLLETNAPKTATKLVTEKWIQYEHNESNHTIWGIFYGRQICWGSHEAKAKCLCK